MTMLEKAARDLAERWLERDQHRAEQGGCEVRLLIEGYLPSARDAVRLVLHSIREPDEAVKHAMFNDGRIAIDAWRTTIDAILTESIEI